MSAEVLRGRYGAVAAGGALAASTALKVLQDGGNAVDAAIAGSAVQCVAEMPWCGIGGDAFAIVRTSDGAVHSVNGSGVAPVGVLEALGARPQVPRFGSVSAAVPGLVDAWGSMHGRYGTVPLVDLLEPARRYAADGVPLDARLLAALCEIPELEGGDQLLGLLDGVELRPGALFRQPDLADVIGALAADGPAALYHGELAARIASHAAERGGALSPADLAAHATEWLQPLSARYRNAVVHTNPPVSMGVLLLVCLRVIEQHYPDGLPRDLGACTDDLVRLKHLVFDRVLPQLGDPLHGANPDVLADAAIADLQASLAASAGLGVPDREQPPMGSDTTSLAVSASDGSSVCFIHSLFNEFGARELVPGTGIILNDRLANLRPGTGRNALVGGRRPLHTLHGYLAQLDEGPFVTGATPGGRGQVQVNLQVLLRILDHGEDVQAAVRAPRWVNGLPRRSSDDRTLYLESPLAPLAPALGERGHTVEVTDAHMSDYFGNCSVVGHDLERHTHSAAADHRRAGHAAVW